MTKTSQARVAAFFDDFIRSEYVQTFTAERDGDFINEPDRAERCADAAEDGADGKTHAEVIDDWRDAFAALLRDRKSWNDPERFAAAVRRRFDDVEDWHQRNGSLHEQIG